ncbi:hypothetical protein KYI07_11615 (plasmid) [Macrococcus psychrotolerans]|uniref:Uncharacterized protein n=1 Tax=Macrococcus psychrotolerans TaxID=3039389 RepID=A0AAT9P8Q0_9STAP|nr:MULTISPECIES: hypothetical protein [Macrococcus]QYA34062.1 hypothetical protein KYI10_11730 [Macrococcus sp. 19Msa1099]QYA38847.1 hypothetical protein KYI07_11615 [Macrococcus caseolyticus]QYA77570.1 hypothetical protein KYI12_11705 [Macrococcus caseolyticus]
MEKKKSKIKTLNRKVKNKIKDDFRSVAEVEEGSIINALRKLYIKLFKS